MANCRTCTALGGYCSVTGRVFLGTIPAFIHIPTAYTPAPGVLPDECQWQRGRETPLLVDALVKALQDLWDSRFTDGDTSGQYPCGCDLYNTVMLTPEQCEIIQAALARYKEEVGDA